MRAKFDLAPLAFIISMWLATRLIIFVAFFIIAPRLPSTTAALSSLSGLERLNLFDGSWYASIVEHGYSYTPDRKQYNIAFFPLFPLTISLLHQLAIPIPIGAVLVNNAAFFGMLFVVFAWVRERCDIKAARWTIATLCCAPMSLFGSTAYSEGLLMLLSSIGLSSLGERKIGIVFVSGFLASLVRFPGIALAPAYAIVAYVNRRTRLTWLLPLAPIGGVIAFSIFCKSHFGDWLAFVHAQAGWRSELGFNAMAWRNLFGAGIASVPMLHLVMIVAATALWFGRGRFPLILSTALAFAALDAERWAWNGSEYVLLFTIGSVIAAIVFRKQLGLGPVIFVLVSIIIISLTGAPISVDRFGYAVVPGVFALALASRHFPAFGYAAIAVMSIDLFTFALRFARGIFVA